MSPSSSLHYISAEKQHRPTTTDATTSNVHGWLMGVPPPFPENDDSDYDDNDNNNSNNDNTIPTLFSKVKGRPLSIASISSEDSVNLDELIKANYTSDMDDETSLPDLADLDLDDSDEEFWKMDESSIASHKVTPLMKPKNTTPASSTISTTRIVSPIPPSSLSSRHRSGSLSSENSMTSQSTVTYRAPFMHSSTSSSTVTSTSTATYNGSSNNSKYHYQRSQQQQQQQASSPTTSSLLTRPTPVQSRSFNTNTNTNNSNNNNNNNEPTSLPARSGSRIGMSPSRLAKRASHIPAPSSSRLATPTPQRTLSTRSTSSSVSSGLARFNSTATRGHTTGSEQQSSLFSSPTTPRTTSRLGNRASHIPSTATSRARSPLFGNNSSSAGQRSSSIFGLQQQQPFPSSQSPSSHIIPRSTKSTTRSASRIGMAKRSAY
ncbi:hypothetical protein BDA99DRAFT_536165 [Phascolomyces articulosus]|uniref:Uncharacterized protein n=1 Tax=Phascolomyces articulosus TaxID=60185 RepID=A0AAD5PFF0_9FUNG|nr:hypothetical protein BDA99DRAFT_536165 [Phascolomyces articulosus]